ncbi:MAG: response regulator [Pseudomonadota bacterium]
MKEKILVVDDAQFMRMMLSNILAESGYEVVGEAGDGQEGIDKYQALKPDLVTMDIVMPGMDGIDAVREIIKLDPEAKIVMVTAMGQEKLMEKAVRAGAKGFIVKPFNPARVVEEVKKVLGQTGSVTDLGDNNG